MTEERWNRDHRQETQNIRGAGEAVSNARQVTARVILTLLAASGTLHHVFQRSSLRTKRAVSSNWPILAKCH